VHLGANQDRNRATHMREVLGYDLQHSSAQFNHRQVLRLCRSALIAIDRFAIDELNNWAGDVIHPDEWHQLLSIKEIRVMAITVAKTRLDNYRDDPEALITACPRCTHEAMLRPQPDTGASCLVCGHVPIVKD
jgi:ribosomal protein S27E